MMHSDIERVLLDSATIGDRVQQIAAEVSRDYAAADELLLVGILKGAFIFLADLARSLGIPHRVDFMALSSYGATTASDGTVRIIMDLREPIVGKHVLVVEDIIDTGYTLSYLLRVLGARNPASLRACALLDKSSRRQVDVSLDYVGFQIPDVWVVGYGLDYTDTYRTLPYIGVLKPAVYTRKRAEE